MKQALVISVILSLLLPVLAYAAPHIEFEQIRHDFGPVKEGEQLQYDFKFTNKGDEDLIIEKIAPTWGVKAYRAGQGPIKPGESDIITVTADTLGKEPGKFTTGARIYTNDPNVRTAVLVIKARIVEEEE